MSVVEGKYILGFCKNVEEKERTSMAQLYMGGKY